MSDSAYEKKLKTLFSDQEGRCRRCGVCCGANGSDPCVQLAVDADGKYFCRVYENRLGPQKTVSGQTFTCVQIRENLRKGARYSGCSYC